MKHENDELWDDATVGLQPAQLLVAAVRRQATDLVLGVGRPPMLRIDETFEPLPFPALTADDTRRLTYALMTDGPRAKLERVGALVTSFAIRELARFRLEVHLSRGAVSSTFRILPIAVPSDDDARLPAKLREHEALRGTLTVIAGPPRSGKTYAYGALLGAISGARRWRIISVEHPIEILQGTGLGVLDQIDVASECTWRDALAATHGAECVAISDLGAPDALATALDRADAGAAIIGVLDAANVTAAVRRLRALAGSDLAIARLAELTGALLQLASPRTAPVLVARPELAALVGSGR